MQNEAKCQNDRCGGEVDSPPRSRRVLAAFLRVRRHEDVAATRGRSCADGSSMQRFAAQCSALQGYAALWICPARDIQNEANRPIGPSPNPLPAITMIA
jgi:hypothetical protein